MPVSKIDPKVIFASDAPSTDKPPVFNDKTKGWDEARANDGRPTIKQMNKLQQDTDLKILWLNENSVTPYDESIDYPDGAVTLKDGSFKILEGGTWVEFLDKSSIGLGNVNNTSDLNKPISTATQTALNAKADLDPVKRGIGNTYDSSLSYNINDRVLLDDGTEVISTIASNTNDPNVNMTGWRKPQASEIFDKSGLNQQEVNTSTSAKFNNQNTIFITDLIADSTAEAASNYTKLQAHADTGKTLSLPAGVFYIDGSVNLKFGQEVYGKGSFRYSLDSSSFTRLISAQANTALFKCDSGVTGSANCPTIEDCILVSDLPILFNDLTGLTVSNSIAKTILLKGSIRNNVLIPKTSTSTGVGMRLGLVFDSQIEGNLIYGFDAGLALIGCDLNSVRDNRFMSQATYSILELSAGSFGSQNEIQHNDMINCGNTFVKTTSNHARLFDNYCEQTNAGLQMFFDASFVSMPTYSWLPLNTNQAGQNFRFTTVMRDNRADGQHLASVAVYRYQPTGQTYGEIIDGGTTGTPNANTLLLVNGDGTTAAGVVTRYSSGAKASFNFKGSNFGTWDGFKTVQKPSRFIDGSNLGMSASTLTANNAFASIRLTPSSFFLLAGAPTAYVSTQQNSGLFKDATEQVIVRITARQIKSDSGNANETLYTSLARFSSATLISQTGGTTFALSTEFQTFEVRGIVGFTDATYGIGCPLVRSNNTSDAIEIKSIEFISDFSKTVTATSVSSRSAQITTSGANGEILALVTDGSATSRAIFKFVGGGLMKVAEVTTSATAITLTAAYSSNIATVSNAATTPASTNTLQLFYRPI